MSPTSQSRNQLKSLKSREENEEFLKNLAEYFTKLIF